MDGNHGAQRYETVIIGGGQAGLATGYHLARLGRSFVILEADRRIGDVWRRRWDSLHLFTPARHDGLPGWKFPANGWSFPSRDNMADYLEAYAARFHLPVRTGMPVDGVTSGRRRRLPSAAHRKFLTGSWLPSVGFMRLPAGRRAGVRARGAVRGSGRARRRRRSSTCTGGRSCCAGW